MHGGEVVGNSISGCFYYTPSASNALLKWSILVFLGTSLGENCERQMAIGTRHSLYMCVMTMRSIGKRWKCVPVDGRFSWNHFSPAFLLPAVMGNDTVRPVEKDSPVSGNDPAQVEMTCCRKKSYSQACWWGPNGPIAGPSRWSAISLLLLRHIGAFIAQNCFPGFWFGWRGAGNGLMLKFCLFWIVVPKRNEPEDN